MREVAHKIGLPIRKATKDHLRGAAKEKHAGKGSQKGSTKLQNPDPSNVANPG